jgi:maltooligosyltrehalose trehalohydrolase
VRQGRRAEFAAFQWQGDLPDPQDQATFSRAGLSRERRLGGHHRTLFEFYRELIRVRNAHPALSYLSKDHMEVTGIEKERALFVRRWRGDSVVFTVLHFGDAAASIALPVPPGRWERRLDSTEQRWAGPGSASPLAVTSEGDVTLSLGPKGCLVFARTG